jgi:hypothetical protein
MILQAEATIINKAGYLTWDTANMPVAATKDGQFGIGKSLSASPGTWSTMGYNTDNYCK